jgi:hypothetical protein
MIPVVTMALGAIGGYFLQWHEPYWFMSVFIGFLGLLSGLLCSAALFLIRALPVVGSRRRTRRGDSALSNTPTWEH